MYNIQFVVHRWRQWFGCTLLVLALLVSPVAGVARAEDETPAAPEVVTETTSEAAPIETTDSAVTDTAPTEPLADVAAATSDSTPVEASSDSAPTEAAVDTVTDTASEVVTESVETIETTPAEVAPTETPAEVIAAAAETGNEVVVLDAAGEAVPLASQVAETIIQQGDPMWCPVGTLPGGTGCTSSFATFTGAGGLLQELQTNSATFSGDGTIYIAYDYDGSLESGPISLDGNIFTNLGALTLQGGWDFDANTVGQTDGEAFHTNINNLMGVEVINWGDNVTINNLDINGAQTPLVGLRVETTGDITLENVTVSGSAATGALLNNSSGDGSVSVTNGVFSINGGDGLYVETTGNITVDTIKAGFNGNDGADLRAFGVACGTPEECAATGNIQVSNSFFNLNGLEGGTDFGSDGLVAQATQDIFVTNVTAGFNDGTGMFLNSGAIESVVITGGEYNNNGNNGIGVQTAGNITISDVIANTNVSNGAQLRSINLSGDNTISLSNSVFNQNGQDVFDQNDPEFTICLGDFYCNGIYASIDGGNISLFNVTASGNYNNGAVLDNTFSCEDVEDCVEPPTGSITVSHSDLSSNGQGGGFEEECGQDNEAGIAFNGALACEGLVTFADDNSTVTVDCSSVNGNYNYGAELYFENGGVLSLNGNVFVDNGLGDAAIREAGTFGQIEGDGRCTPPETQPASNGGSAGIDPLNCNFAPEGATAFETGAQIARLYNLPGPFMISCFPDGSLGFWHVVDGVGVRMSGFAAAGWEEAIGADGFIFDQIDPDSFRVTFTLLPNATALGLPELGGDADWYRVQFFAPSGEQLVNAYLPIGR